MRKVKVHEIEERKYCPSLRHSLLWEGFPNSGTYIVSYIMRNDSVRFLETEICYKFELNKRFGKDSFKLRTDPKKVCFETSNLKSCFLTVTRAAPPKMVAIFSIFTPSLPSPDRQDSRVQYLLAIDVTELSPPSRRAVHVTFLNSTRKICGASYNNCKWVKTSNIPYKRIAVYSKASWQILRH